MKTYIDLDAIFDDLFDTVNHFHGTGRNSLGTSAEPDHSRIAGRSSLSEGRRFIDENIDYYPGYSYPPMNIFLNEDMSLNFEFALAGFDEKNIELSFSGDYMIFSAHMGKYNAPDVYYLKRRLKLKDIDKQKYYVPMDKYEREKVNAVFKNGILKVTIPPRLERTLGESINITIITAE